MDALDSVGRVAIDDIRLSNWRKDIEQNSDGLKVRWRVDITDIRDGKTVELVSKWRAISVDANPTEVVKALENTAMDLIEHEFYEHFLYKERRIYNPHMKVDALFDICENEDPFRA